MKKIYVLGALILPLFAFGAGTVTVTYYSDGTFPNHGKKVSVAWVGDASDGSVPNTIISLHGIVAKVVTNPGSTAPTDNYDLACGDPSDTALDVFAGTLANRDTTNTEQVYPVAAGATMGVYAGDCTLQLTNNSVNSATGSIDFYVIRP